MPATSANTSRAFTPRVERDVLLTKESNPKYTVMLLPLLLTFGKWSGERHQSEKLACTVGACDPVQHMVHVTVHRVTTVPCCACGIMSNDLFKA